MIVGKRFTAYRLPGFDIKIYSNDYRQYSNEITFPLHTLMSDENVEYEIGNLKKGKRL